MNPPVKASSVWREMPFIKGSKGPGRLRELTQILSASADQARERRTRVLAHDWARRRLCLIFGYSDANHWNGYVPGKTLPPDVRSDELRPNPSPHRAALVQLLRDVHEYEQTGQLPEGAITETEQLTLAAGE